MAVARLGGQSMRKVATNLNGRRPGVGRGGVTKRLRALVRGAKGPALWAALLASLGAFAFAAWLNLDQWRQNDIVASLAAGKDIAIDIASAPDAVLLARVAFLLKRDRIDDAQTAADISASRASPPTRAAISYNLANARLRLAIEAIEQGALDRAIAQVNLAKNAYRGALRIDPAAWDAKYNLDVAMRLVRDLPQPEETEEKAPKDEPVELWTDLPGVPKGLP